MEISIMLCVESLKILNPLYSWRKIVINLKQRNSASIAMDLKELKFMLLSKALTRLHILTALKTLF